MLEAKVVPIPVLWCCVISPLKILWDSLKILLSNKLVFFSILCFTTLPLSFLTFTATISTHPLRSHIYHLEAVARAASTRVEARHVWHESRVDAISLLRTRALFSLLCLPLSLAAAVSSVHAAQGKPASAVFSAVRSSTWKRPAVTIVFVYVILLAFAPVPRVLAAAFDSPPWARVLARAIGAGAEVHLMAALGLGMVASVADERVGWEAIRVGLGLMWGRRVFCGWVLSGLLFLVSGFMNRKLKVLLENNEDFKIGNWDKTILVCLYALVVLLSYVITTVFYCDGRSRHDDDDDDDDEEEHECDVEISSSL